MTGKEKKSYTFSLHQGKGHKRGRKSGIRKTKSDLTVDFLNIRGVLSKIHDVNRHSNAMIM
jgi:hypothetical protein